MLGSLLATVASRPRHAAGAHCYNASFPPLLSLNKVKALKNEAIHEGTRRRKVQNELDKALEQSKRLQRVMREAHPAGPPLGEGHATPGSSKVMTAACRSNVSSLEEDETADIFEDEGGDVLVIGMGDDDLSSKAPTTSGSAAKAVAAHGSVHVAAARLAAAGPPSGPGRAARTGGAGTRAAGLTLAKPRSLACDAPANDEAPAGGASCLGSDGCAPDGSGAHAQQRRGAKPSVTVRTLAKMDLKTLSAEHLAAARHALEAETGRLVETIVRMAADAEELTAVRQWRRGGASFLFLPCRPCH